MTDTSSVIDHRLRDDDAVSFDLDSVPIRPARVHAGSRCALARYSILFPA